MLKEVHFRISVVTASPEVPNEIRMRYEPLEKKEMLRYIKKKQQKNIYTAAARLWGQGVPWQNAITIVTDAFNDLAS